jgi:hypothetical protein
MRHESCYKAFLIPEREEFFTIFREEKMSEINETKQTAEAENKLPILQLNRLSYVKINGKILESTGAKLDKYILYASRALNTEITSGDVIEHGLKLLFDRDTGFKDWLKKN